MNPSVIFCLENLAGGFFLKKLVLNNKFMNIKKLQTNVFKIRFIYSVQASAHLVKAVHLKHCY